MIRQRIPGVLERDYPAYDGNGNLLGTRDLLATTNVYAYDALDRLTWHSGPIALTEYTYDRNGNRLAITQNGAVRTYAYQTGSNRLATAANDPVVTDPNGNTLSIGNRTFTWNAFNRLVAATVGGETVASYAYNALGQRVRKTARGVTTWYAYGLNGELLAELDDTGTVQKEYVWLDGLPLVILEGARILYLHPDHLGTPRVATDGTGTVVWRWKSDAFGATQPDEDPDGDGRATVVNLRFPGQYYDNETGLYYNYFRYYDSSIGRYITSDPIGIAGGLNTYSYVLNNPLYWIDPYGLDITVSFNPNAAAGFGHVGLGVNTPNTVGQRPQPGASSIQMGLGLDVPGEISPDPAAPSSVTIPTTPEQDQNAQQCIDMRTQEQQDYNLYNNNCTLFVRQCLGAAGINTPNTILPRTLFNDLQRNFGGNP